MTALEMELIELRKGSRPILVGPWLSEVGFELLYWIPFLRKALAGIPPERIWILSRGGCRSWYADISPSYLELYDRFEPAELAALNRQRIAEQAARGRTIGLRKGQITAKQFALGTCEQEMLTTAAREAGLSNPAVLHPSLMYRAFRPIWRHRKGDMFSAWQRLTQATRLRAPVADLGLPSRYVAVKFYASEANPAIAANQRLVQQIVRHLADQIHVVLLHTATAYDEHGEFEIHRHPWVHRAIYQPKNNLELQTRILAGAQGFVGTYGGFAYLAPFLRIPTLAVYGVLNFRKDHYRLMSEVAKRSLDTRFAVTRLEGALPLLQRDAPWMAHAA